MDTSPSSSLPPPDPATVSSSGSVSTPTTVLQRFRADQMAVLKAHFEVNPRPSAEEVRGICAEINESERKVKTWFSNWRSKGKKAPPVPPAAPAVSTPTASEAPSEVLVDSVKVRPPPKRVTNFSALPPTSMHGQGGAGEPFTPVMTTPLLVNYPPPPEPIHATSLPGSAIANITRLMMSSYFTPCVIEDYEVRRRRRLDDEAANNVVQAAKRGLPIPTQFTGYSAVAPPSILSAATVPPNTQFTSHNSNQNNGQTYLSQNNHNSHQLHASSSSTSMAGASSSSHQSHKATSVISNSSASTATTSFLAKPKSKKELKRAAKLITATLKKLKKAGGGLHPDAAGLLQQAKNLGLLPQGAAFDGDDDVMSGSDSDSTSSSSSSSSSGSGSGSSSGSGSGTSSSGSEGDMV
ncbi:hypothetical protein BC830DRAFT_1098811, partial [Chytriomyces sp. MP71]